MNAQTVIEKALHNCGFMTAPELRALTADPGHRLDPILVRTGGGRFEAPAQDVSHFIAIIEQHARRTDANHPDRDYIRDVSATPATLARWRADRQSHAHQWEGTYTPAGGAS